MCTALSFHGCGHFFGRTLDLEYSYNESVTLTPRNFPLVFRRCPPLDAHYAILGVAHVAQGFPLYYDAVNEKGLAMAALNFPRSACYQPVLPRKENVAAFELIGWVLSQCASVEQARGLLERTGVTGEDFNRQLPCTPLHWLIADSRRCLVAEPLEGGLRLYDDPVGVLTNEPAFEFQLFALNNHLSVSPMPAENRFSPYLGLTPYSRGMGGLGLPGDFSSQSRFVRAAFAAQNSRRPGTPVESITQFFHILGCVEQPKGCVRVPGGDVITVYTSCCDTGRGIYYYTTQENRQITGFDMHRENVDGTALVSRPLVRCQHLHMEN